MLTPVVQAKFAGVIRLASYAVDLYFDRALWPEGAVIIGYRRQDGRPGGNIDSLTHKEQDMEIGLTTRRVLCVRLWCGKPDTFRYPGQLSIMIHDQPETKVVNNLKFVIV